MLVDIRHEATHNELPQLPALHIAADAALAWLRASYWAAQAQALQDAADTLVAAVRSLVSGRRASNEDDGEEAPREAWRAAVKAVKAAAPPFAAEAVANALLRVTSDDHVEDAVVQDAATQLAKHWPSLPSCLASTLVQQAAHAWHSTWHIWWHWMTARSDVADVTLRHALRRLLLAHAACGASTSSALDALQSLAAVVQNSSRAAEDSALAALCSVAGSLTGGGGATDTSEGAVEALEAGLQRAKDAVQDGQEGAAACVRVERWRACAVGALPDAVLLS